MVTEDTVEVPPPPFFDSSELPKMPEPELGKRYNKGKAKLSMIMEVNAGLTAIAEVFEYGAKKYDRGNWRKGLPWTEIADSSLRHLSLFLAGENLDPESSLKHIHMAAWNLLVLSDMVQTRPDLDDRPVVEGAHKDE